MKPRNAKQQRIQHCMISRSKMPAAYTSNTAKEQAMMTYIDSWAATFARLYPQRR